MHEMSKLELSLAKMTVEVRAKLVQCRKDKNRAWMGIDNC